MPGRLSRTGSGPEAVGGFFRKSGPWSHWPMTEATLGSHLAAAGIAKRREMVLTLVLVDVVGTGLARVAAYFWPQIMTCAREHLVPWIDRNIPDLAGAVRLAFHDLDEIEAELCRAVRAAWCKLRAVLISQAATFVELFNGDCALRITSNICILEDCDTAPVTVVTEQELDWEGMPEEIRAAAVSNGIRGMSIDIVRARDQLLAKSCERS